MNRIYQLSYNPITTHGVQHIIQAVDAKTSAVSMLDISVGLDILINFSDRLK